MIYYIPVEVKENGKVQFSVETHKLKTATKRAYEIFREAVKYLRESQPKSHSECKFCSWGNDFANFLY